MDPYVLVKIGVEQGRSGVHKDAGKYPNWKDVRCEVIVAIDSAAHARRGFLYH